MGQQPSPMSGKPSSPPPDPALMPSSAPQDHFAGSPEVSTRSGGPAFLFGSIFGLIPGAGFVVLGILLAQVPPYLNMFLLMLILWGLPLFTQWICSLLAGLFASWRTGRTGTGVRASFWVNPGYLLGALVVFFLLRPAIEHNYAFSSIAYISIFLISGVIYLLLSVSSGAGFGALGGLIGKALRNRAIK
ncbi:MAG: hypothetical protein J2P36_06555 [Ktedonobacteraceae bacterium]|nr:hypothetical protein [Ktedonobacteraceae bacterium]